MVKIQFFLFSLFAISMAYSQKGSEVVGDGIENKYRKLSLETFSYPVFLNGERHSSFDLGYSLDEKFETELQGFYDTYLLSDIVRIALRGKYYAGEKLYLFSGVASEFEFDISNGYLSPPRLMLMNGAGYDVKKGLNIEAKHEFQFNKANLGNYGLPSLISVLGKYKF